MPARDTRKNFALFVDGRGYIGDAEEFTPPALTLVTEEFRAGGMDAPVERDMGMEALACSFILTAYDADVLALFGVGEGRDVPITCREVLESLDGTTKAVVHNIRGMIKKLEPAAAKPGAAANLTVEVACTYYKQVHNGRVIHEIDPLNMVRIIAGVDRLAGQRAALAI